MVVGETPEKPTAKSILEKRKCLKKEQQLKRKKRLQKKLSIMDLLLIPASLPTSDATRTEKWGPGHWEGTTEDETGKVGKAFS